jgi:transposase
MYVRIRLNKSGTTTIYLIDSVREAGKKNATSKVVKCFGSSSDEGQLAAWSKEAEHLKHQLAKQKISSRQFMKIKQSSDVESCQVEDFGMRYLYGNIFDSLFGGMRLNKINKQTLADLVLMRIASPVSKLHTANISDSFGIKCLTCNKIYKLMDGLDDSKINAIKKYVLSNTRKLIGSSIQVMFYDLTTICFEANSKTELKDFGYSKDGKSQHVQISLALIVTECGLPVGYEIFRGNTFEGSTLIPTLQKLKDDYKVEDVTIVADSAMLSEANISMLAANNFKFIVAAKVRNMSAKLTKIMLDQDGYLAASDNLCYKSIKLNEHKTLITVFSQDRKRKDEYDRNKALKKIAKVTGKQAKSALRGALNKPYVSLDQDSVIGIDEAKLEQSKKFDGYFGFITNTDLDPQEVISHYRGLWQVEQSFRITKHNLKIRPVYHYVDRRIKAHFAICYLSLALVRSVEYSLKAAGKHMPMEQLHTYLSQVKAITLNVAGDVSTIVSDIPQPLREIFMSLNITMPKRYNFIGRV